MDSLIFASAVTLADKMRSAITSQAVVEAHLARIAQVRSPVERHRPIDQRKRPSPKPPPLIRDWHTAKCGDRFAVGSPSRSKIGLNGPV